METWLKEFADSQLVEEVSLLKTGDYLSQVRQLIRSEGISIEDALEILALRVGLTSMEKYSLLHQYNNRYGVSKQTLSEYLEEYWESKQNSGMPKEAVINELHAETGLPKESLQKVVDRWFSELPEYKPGEPSGSIDPDFDFVPFTAPTVQSIAEDKTPSLSITAQKVQLKTKQPKVKERVPNRPNVSSQAAEKANLLGKVFREAIEKVTKAERGENKDPVVIIKRLNNTWMNEQSPINQKILVAMQTIQNLEFLDTFNAIKEQLITEALAKHEGLKREDISAGTTNFDAFKRTTRTLGSRLVLSPSQPDPSKVKCLLCDHVFQHPDSEIAKRSGGYIAHVANHLRTHGLGDVAAEMCGQYSEYERTREHGLITATRVAYPERFIPDESLLAKPEWRDGDQATVSAYLKLFPFAIIQDPYVGRRAGEYTPIALRSREEELASVLRDQQDIILPTSEEIYVDTEDLAKDIVKLGKQIFNMDEEWINPEIARQFVDEVRSDMGLPPDAWSFTASTRELLASMEDLLYDYFLDHRGTGLEPDFIRWRQKRREPGGKRRHKVRLDELQRYKGRYTPTTTPTSQLLAHRQTEIAIERKWLEDHDIHDEDYARHEAKLRELQETPLREKPPQARQPIKEIFWVCSYCDKNNGMLTPEEVSEYKVIQEQLADPRFVEENKLAAWLRLNADNRSSDEYAAKYEQWSTLGNALPAMSTISAMRQRLTELESSSGPIIRPDTPTAEWSQQCKHCHAWYIRPIQLHCPHPECEELNNFSREAIQSMANDYFKPGAGPGPFKINAVCHKCGQNFQIPIPRAKGPYYVRTLKEKKVTVLREGPEAKQKPREVTEVPEELPTEKKPVVEEVQRGPDITNPEEVKAYVQLVLKDFLELFKEMIAEGVQKEEKPLTTEDIVDSFNHFILLRDIPRNLRMKLNNNQIEQLLILQKQSRGETREARLIRRKERQGSYRSSLSQREDL